MSGCDFCEGPEGDGLLAAVAVLQHQAAGYRVYVYALGEDGADGYRLETESRDGRYIEAKGGDMPAACLHLVELLK